MKKESIEINKDNQDDKTSYYMKYLDENKKDINVWLEFIEYQTRKQKDQEVGSTLGQYERKMAIFKKAITENPDSYRLRIEYIKFKARSIETTSMYNWIDVIEREYQSLINEKFEYLKSLKKNQRTEASKLLLPIFMETWFEFIGFFLSNNSSNILVFKIKKSFKDCFEFFLSSDKLFGLIKPSYLFYDFLIKLLDSYCRFLAKTGFVEKSIGVYQSLIDFNISTDKEQEIDFERKKVFLRCFMILVYQDLVRNTRRDG